MLHPVQTHVILLRAIGPATHKLMSMTQWREAARHAGFVEPETVLNTGNMVAGFDGSAEAAAKQMSIVLRGFGLADNVVPIVRPPALLHLLLKANPIPRAARERPAQTGVYFFAAARPDFGWLRQHDGPEAVHVVADHLVVDFSQDVARSSRLIRLIEKNCGLNTSRSWSSMSKLADRCAAWEIN